MAIVRGVRGAAFTPLQRPTIRTILSPQTVRTWKRRKRRAPVTRSRSPAGTTENSPALERWACERRGEKSRQGRQSCAPCNISFVPAGTCPASPRAPSAEALGYSFSPSGLDGGAPSRPPAHAVVPWAFAHPPRVRKRRRRYALPAQYKKDARAICPGGTPPEISRGPARTERSPRTSAPHARLPRRGIGEFIFAPRLPRGVSSGAPPGQFPERALDRGLRSLSLAGPRLIFCEAPPGREG